jgi:hypothetical protein
MRLVDMNLICVYLALMSVMLVLVWMVTIARRWMTARFGLLRHV